MALSSSDSFMGPRFAEAIAVLESMPRYGLRPTLLSYVALESRSPAACNEKAVSRAPNKIDLNPGLPFWRKINRPAVLICAIRIQTNTDRGSPVRKPG